MNPAELAQRIAAPILYRRFYLGGVERFYAGNAGVGWFEIPRALALAAGVHPRGNLYTPIPPRQPRGKRRKPQ